MARTITLAPSGFSLRTIHAELIGEDRQAIVARQNPALRRGIHLALYRLEDGGHVAALTYESTRGRERPFTWVIDAPSLEELIAAIRERAGDALPPGTGYPADLQYIDRQDHLREEFQGLVIYALSQCLINKT